MDSTLVCDHAPARWLFDSVMGTSVSKAVFHLRTVEEALAVLRGAESDTSICDALHRAARVASEAGLVEVVRLCILECSLSENMRTKLPFSCKSVRRPFMWEDAITKKRADVVDFLFSHRPGYACTQRSDTLLTPLLCALRRRDPDMHIVGQILDASQGAAAAFAPDQCGDTPLVCAIRMKHVGAVEPIVQCRREELERPSEFDETEGQTPLAVACVHHSPAVVSTLMDLGARAQVPSPADGMQAVHHLVHAAVDSGGFDVTDEYIECLRLLFMCPTFDINVQTVPTQMQMHHYRGFQAIHLCASPTSLRRRAASRVMSEILRQPGVDVDARTGRGDTPLNLALKASDCNLAAMLLERGASPFARSQNGHDAYGLMCKVWRRPHLGRDDSLERERTTLLLMRRCDFFFMTKLMSDNRHIAWRRPLMRYNHWTRSKHIGALRHVSCLRRIPDTTRRQQHLDTPLYMLRRMKDAFVALCICACRRGALRSAGQKRKSPHGRRVLPRFMRKKRLVYDDNKEQFFLSSTHPPAPSPPLLRRGLRPGPGRTVHLSDDVCVHIFTFLTESSFCIY